MKLVSVSLQDRIPFEDDGLMIVQITETADGFHVLLADEATAVAFGTDFGNTIGELEGIVNPAALKADGPTQPEFDNTATNVTGG